MSTLARTLEAILVRDLTTLRMELEAYPDDAGVWRVEPGISNSAGTLALHMAGNLQHFIGAILGKSGYRRDRAAEFALRELPRAELLRQVDAAIAALRRTLPALGDAELGAEYPEPVANVKLNTGDFLVHLATHLTYHLGQLDYHRRMVTGGGPLSGALSPTRLWSATPQGG